MTEQPHPTPSRVYARTDPGIDPPTVALGLEIESRTREGSVILFLDREADEPAIFELHRIRGAFRISSPLTEPGGAFASAQAAIQAGWAAVDAGDMRATGELPPIGALLGPDDPHGGFR